MQTIAVYENEALVGNLAILDRESFSFSYSESWLDSCDSFVIDPLLPLDSQTYYSKQLWGAFCDISPDRWGKLIISRTKGQLLRDYEYMLEVSDYFRIGALRLKLNETFVRKSNDIPKLLHLNQLQDSTLRIESDSYTKRDLDMLLEPSGSLGGAQPKASIVDGDKLYIAKFYSKDDLYSTSLWEAVMLEISKRAKINTTNYKIAKCNNRNVILIERFDRIKSNRIPFISARTLLGVNSRKEADSKSYVDIAKLLDSKNKEELFRRMLFNALFGNTDDHLRNHALLYDKSHKEWHLSPAYDLNPTPYAYEKQRHALNFVDSKNSPSLNLCREIASEFELNDDIFLVILNDCVNAGAQWQNIALNFGIKPNEIQLFKQNFEHRDIENARKMISENLISNSSTSNSLKEANHRTRKR